SPQSRSPRWRERSRGGTRGRNASREKLGRPNFSAGDEPDVHDRKRGRPRSRDPQTSRSLTDAGGRSGENYEAAESSARRKGPLPSQAESFALVEAAPEKPKDQPNFRNTGLLAAASNSVTQVDGTSVVLKYHEPPEARKPSPRDQWKLFVFKESDILDTLEL